MTKGPPLAGTALDVSFSGLAQARLVMKFAAIVRTMSVRTAATVQSRIVAFCLGSFAI